jgi:AcrR family transcriptional regulator
MKPIEIINQNEDHVKSRILDHIEKKLSNQGFRNFTVDQIANELHISKKTIYKTFRTKEELIRSAIINQLTKPYRYVINIIEEERNTVEKFIELSKIVEQYYSAFNEIAIERLRYDFRDLADYIEQFRIHRINPLINRLLKDGKEKELILDIPYEIIIKVFTSALGAIATSKSDNLSNYSYHQEFRLTFNILLNGILKEKGKKIFNQTINKM